VEIKPSTLTAPMATFSSAAGPVIRATSGTGLRASSVGSLPVKFRARRTAEEMGVKNGVSCYQIHVLIIREEIVLVLVSKRWPFIEC
jgi:hypothetical protein